MVSSVLRKATLWLGLSAVTLSVFVAAGCQQGIGQRCHVQADCDSGLICVIPQGVSPQVGGVCQATNVPDAAAFDFAVSADMSVFVPQDLPAPNDL